MSASADGKTYVVFYKSWVSEIGGWTILKYDSDINPSGKGIETKSHPSTPIITVKEDSNNKIEILNYVTNDYGIKGVSTCSIIRIRKQK